jgi:multicomponent Na+:H+ antiporter subunit G
MTVIAMILMLIGGLFMFLGVLGLVRMPDVFNKLQAGTKATTLGLLSLIAALIILRPQWWGKLTAIALLILLTNPVGSHNLARAAHASGERKEIAGVDRLELEEEAS